MTMLASQITSLTVVYSIVYSKKTSKLRVTGFVREIHRGPVNFPHKWPVKMFPFDDVIMWTLSFIMVPNFVITGDDKTVIFSVFGCGQK